MFSSENYSIIAVLRKMAISVIKTDRTAQEAKYASDKELTQAFTSTERKRKTM